MKKSTKVFTGALVATGIICAAIGTMYVHNANEETKRLNALKEAAAKVDGEIIEIGQVELDDKDRIDTAKADYDSLSDEGKKYVVNYDLLTSADKEYLALKAEDDKNYADARTVDSLIEAIGPKESITVDSQDAVTTARAGYNALNDKAKEYVNLKTTLEEDELQLQAKLDEAAALAKKKAEEEAAAKAKAEAEAAAVAKANSNKTSSAKNQTRKNNSSSSSDSNIKTDGGGLYTYNAGDKAGEKAAVEAQWGKGAGAVHAAELDEYMKTIENENK